MSSAAAVIASVAVPITASASGAQKGLWSEGSASLPACAASHFAFGTPPTQNVYTVKPDDNVWDVAGNDPGVVAKIYDLNQIGRASCRERV